MKSLILGLSFVSGDFGCMLMEIPQHFFQFLSQRSLLVSGQTFKLVPTVSAQYLVTLKVYVGYLHLHNCMHLYVCHVYFCI